MSRAKRGTSVQGMQRWCDIPAQLASMPKRKVKKRVSPPLTLPVVKWTERADAKLAEPEQPSRPVKKPEHSD